MAGDVQQLRLVLRRGHAGHGTDLGVADLAALEGVVDRWQRAKRPGHPDLFARHQFAETAFEVQPVGQRTDAVAGPAVVSVEFVQQLEEPVVRGVEVAGQGGDFVGKDLAALLPGCGGRADECRRLADESRRLADERRGVPGQRRSAGKPGWVPIGSGGGIGGKGGVGNRSVLGGWVDIVLDFLSSRLDG